MKFCQKKSLWITGFIFTSRKSLGMWLNCDWLIYLGPWGDCSLEVPAYFAPGGLAFGRHGKSSTRLKRQRTEGRCESATLRSNMYNTWPLQYAIWKTHGKSKVYTKWTLFQHTIGATLYSARIFKWWAWLIVADTDYASMCPEPAYARPLSYSSALKNDKM